MGILDCLLIFIRKIYYFFNNQEWFVAIFINIRGVLHFVNTPTLVSHLHLLYVPPEFYSIIMFKFVLVRHCMNPERYNPLIESNSSDTIFLHICAIRMLPNSVDHTACKCQTGFSCYVKFLLRLYTYLKGKIAFYCIHKSNNNFFFIFYFYTYRIKFVLSRNV